jgi:hypothetical protein
MIASEAEPTYHNRYIMFETDEHSKAWWVDITNLPNGVIVVKLNNRRTIKPPAEYKRLLAADNEMKQAMAAFMIACDKPEENS